MWNKAARVKVGYEIEKLGPVVMVIRPGQEGTTVAVKIWIREPQFILDFLNLLPLDHGNEAGRNGRPSDIISHLRGQTAKGVTRE